MFALQSYTYSSLNPVSDVTTCNTFDWDMEIILHYSKFYQIFVHRRREVVGWGFATKIMVKT